MEREDSMKSKTEIQIEHMTFGETDDGRWVPIRETRTRDNPEVAEMQKNKYLEAEREMPRRFRQFKNYKIMRRTVITTIGEWEDV